MSDRLLPRGVSLIEVLISSTILIIVLTILQMGLMAGMRANRRVEAQLEMDSQALTAFSHLRREVLEASIAGMEATTQGVAFLVPRTEDGALALNASGHRLWNQVVGFRVKAGSGLVREQMALPPAGGGDRLVPVSPAELTPPRGLAYLGTLSLPTRVLASRAIRLETEVVDNSLKVVLELETQVDRRAYGLEVQGRFAPRGDL